MICSDDMDEQEHWLGIENLHDAGIGIVPYSLRARFIDRVEPENRLPELAEHGRQRAAVHSPGDRLAIPVPLFADNSTRW
jgi:hypothetical protein